MVGEGGEPLPLEIGVRPAQEGEALPRAAWASEADLVGEWGVLLPRVPLSSGHLCHVVSPRLTS